MGTLPIYLYTIYMNQRTFFQNKHIPNSIIAHFRWLSVGIGIKRWLLLLGAGAFFVGIGIAYVVNWLYQADLMPAFLYKTAVWQPVLIIFLTGGGMILFAIWRIGLNLVAPFRNADQSVVSSLIDHSRQGRGVRIVAIGGGTGMPSLLRGFVEHTRNITAVITVADDGGSSGRLRQELGVLPPGDFRNNIAALSRDEALMTSLLQYRFGGQDGALRGHAFGNLLLAALSDIAGSFDEGLIAAERVLAMRGKVLPSTLTAVTLTADIETDNEDGTISMQHVVGESSIPKVNGRIRQVTLDPPDARAYPPAIQAILGADIVVMGPGSLYTSILPNLIVPEITQALQRTRALKVYVCNIATQPGETDKYTAADHAAAIIAHTSPDCIDLVLANNNFPDSFPAGRKSELVRGDAVENGRLITADLVDEEKPWRHDSTKVAAAILAL